jgi:ubiquinone/menaquinone biosynthesis C-methylase UbiE
MVKRKGGDFTGLSHDYQRYRPDYPGEITAAGVAFLRAGGRACDAGLLAVDVGAGTGIGTRAWRRALGKDCRIVGVEPSDDMRRQAVESTATDQHITYLAGSAEAIPVATGEAGLVTAAQAAHWFDLPRFYAEADRALGPAGVIAIMANNRDWTASRFLDRYETLLEAHSPGYRRGYRGIDFSAEFASLPWVGATATSSHRWVRRLAADVILGLFMSSSLAQRANETMGEDRFATTIRQMVEEAAETDGLVEFPYVSEIHMARKRRA